MKKQVMALAVVSALLCATSARAEFKSEKYNQVYFRGAFASLTSDRGGEVFTDTAGASGTFNDKKAGFSVAAGLDLNMMDPKKIMDVASLVGNIDVEFSRFSSQLVRQTTSALLAGTDNSNVNVTELNVGIGPKVRIDTLGRFQPYLMPVGLAFLVASPPSNDTTYLDLGLNFGAGLDVLLNDWFSLGADARYTHGFETNNTNMSYYSVGSHVGIHF